MTACKHERFNSRADCGQCFGVPSERLCRCAGTPDLAPGTVHRTDCEFYGHEPPDVGAWDIEAFQH